MLNFIDLTGKRFGNVSVISRAENATSGKKKETMWLCRCDACGKEFTTRSRTLLHGNIKSCGCLRLECAVEGAIKANTKHGATHHRGTTKLYNIWLRMKDRCRNPNSSNYKYYGGRGISVCEEWRHDFAAFRDWALANGYQEGLSIDRIDVNGNYCPENCRWITMAEQQRNKRPVNEWHFKKHEKGGKL